MDYEVIESSDLGDLCQMVRDKLRAGWKPQGGISVTVYEVRDRDGYTEAVWNYAQAITKEPNP